MSITSDREFHIEKMLNAPIERVWDAWTKVEQIAQWWGPKDFTTQIRKMEFREGGEWLLTLYGADGKSYLNKSIYREIVPFRKIVFEHFNPDFISTIVFDATGHQTLLNWTGVFETIELYETVIKTFKADEGLKQNVEKLEHFLAGKKP